MSRVIAYVDGFNLYFGMRQSHWRKYYWLDLPALATSLLKPGQRLVATHYFTACLRHNGRNLQDAQRQSTYLDALTERGSHIQYGHYLEKQRTCRSCQATWPDYEEKMTDVNIAIQLLSDAFDDAFDVALVISGDSDLTTPIHRVRQRFPRKRVIVAFPPNRHSSELKRCATGFLTIGEDKLRNSQLPDQVPTARGHVLQRPAHWQ
jgi:uncharacterized LabA/DUF88 family protein